MLTDTVLTTRCLPVIVAVFVDPLDRSISCCDLFTLTARTISLIMSLQNDLTTPLSYNAELLRCGYDAWYKCFLRDNAKLLRGIKRRSRDEDEDEDDVNSGNNADVESIGKARRPRASKRRRIYRNFSPELNESGNEGLTSGTSSASSSTESLNVLTPVESPQISVRSIEPVRYCVLLQIAI